MRIEYNSPVVLTYALVSTLALMITQFIFPEFTPSLFTVAPGMSWGNPLPYLRLVSHAIGHADWQHLLSNFTLILLLGPILEEKYGSASLLLMMLMTAFITGLLQVAFFSTALMGASGVAFMMIVLSSMTNFRQGRIPLTFILIVVIFIGGEVVQTLKTDNISQFAHIIGGVCGALFGFTSRRRATVR